MKLTKVKISYNPKEQFANLKLAYFDHFHRNLTNLGKWKKREKTNFASGAQSNGGRDKVD